MADENLGNLKYSLHLDTTEFDKQVQDAEKKVDALAKVVESKANATSKKNTDSSGDKQTEQYLQKVQQLADNAQEAIRKMTAQQEKFGEGTTAYKNIGEQIQRLTSYMDMLRGLNTNDAAKKFLDSSGADKAASEYMKIYDVILKVNGEINKLDIANIKGIAGDEVSKVRQEWEQLAQSLSQMASGKVVSGDMTTRLDAIGRSITELQQKTAKAMATDKEAAKAKEKVGAKDPYQAMLATLDKVNAELVRINNLKTIATAKGLDTSGYEKALGILQQIAAEMEKIKNGGGSVSSGQLSGWSSMFTQAKSYASTQTALNRTLDEGKGKANDFVAGVRQMNAELNNQQGIWSQLRPLIGDVFSVYAVKQFLDAIIDVGGEIQKQKLAMASILGDQGEADQLFTQMRGLAVQSPFGILDLVKSTKQLSAFGVEANELYDTMKRLSDISAGVGVDVSRLAYAFGQVKSRTWLDAKELRQISYTGIPMLSELTKYLNSKDNTEKTTAEVRDMISKRQVSFDDMKAVLWKMTDEGGQFYDMQKVISQSVAAKYKNMHDAIDLFMNDLAENNSEVLKAPAEAVTTLVRNYDELIPILTTVVSLWGANKINTMLSTAAMGKNATSVLASALAYKQQYAAQLVVMSQTRTLTAEENALIGSQTRLSASEYALLGANKMLTKNEAALVIATKNLTKEEAIALGASVGMSEAQVIQCQNMSRLEVLTLRAGNAFKTLGASMKAAFLNPVTIAISAMFAIWEAYKRVEDKNNEMQERLNTQKTSANEIYRNITSFQNEHTGDIASMDEAGLKNELEDLKGILKEYDPLWQDAFNNAVVDTTTGAVRSLREQVEYLRGEVQNVKDMANDPHNIMGTAETINSRNDNWWNESLLENAEDYAKSLDKANTAAKSLTISYGKELRAAISKAASSHADFNKALKDEAETLKVNELGGEQQLKVLERYPEIMKEIKDSLPKANESGIFDSYMEWAKMVNTSEFTKGLSGIFQVDKTQDFKNLDESIKRMITDYRLLIHNNEWDLNDREVKMSIVGDFAKFTDNIQDPVVKQLVRDQWAKAIFYVDWQTLGGNKMTEQLTGWKKELNDLTGNNKQFETIIRQANSYSEAIEGIKKAYKDAKDHIVNDSGILMKIGIQVDTKNVGNNKSANKQDYLHIWDNGGVKDAVIDAYNDNVQIIRDSLGLKAIGVDLDDNNKNTNTSKDTGNKTDTALKKLKNRAKMLQETYEEYKKWAEAFGKDEAINKLNEGGLFKQLFGGDATDIDVQTFRNKLESLKNELANMKMTDERTSYLQELLKKMLDIDYNESKKQIEIVTKNIKEQIQEEVKKQDLYKTWFDATGDKDLSKKMSISVVPVETEDSKHFYDELESNLKDAVKKGNLKKIDLSSLLNMDMKDADAEKLFTEKGMQAYYELWKKVKDLMTSAGYEYSKQAANAVKSMLTYEEQVARLERERQDALKGANGNIEVMRGVNSYYDSKEAEIDPQYKQFMSAVTTMTKGAAQQMADAIKNRLVAELGTGAKSIEEYAKAVENVDKQLETSENRIDSFAEAWLTNSQKAFREQQYNSALYNVGNAKTAQSKAFSKMEKTYLAMVKSQQENDGVASQETALAYQNATAEYDSASDEVIKALEVLAKALDKKTELSDTEKTMKVINGMIGKVNDVVSQLGTVGESIGNIFGDSDAIKSITNMASSMTSNASALASFGSNFGKNGGIIGAFVGAGIGMYSSAVSMWEEEYKEAAEQASRAAQAMESYANRLENLLSTNAGGIYSLTLDSETKEQLQAIIDKYPESNDNMGGFINILAGNVRKTAEKALADNSYFEAQLALLQEQKNELQNEYTSTFIQKGEHSGELDDLKEQIAEVQDEIDEFAQNTAKELYGIDVTSWASSFADSLVSAWQEGTDAATAYKEAVSSILSDVAKSVVQQEIIGTYLDSAIKPWLEKFEEANGVMNSELYSELNAIFVGLQGKIDEGYSFLDNWEEIANGYGYSLKEDESASTSSSIQGVTEETADVLAALVEGMRLDLSIQRTAVEQIRDAIGAGENTRSLNAIAEAQVLQLQQIATNTYNTHQELVNLNSKFDEVTAGTKSLSIQ